MTAPAMSRREQNTARTREKLVDAAVRLYAARSIDAVSLREISTAAGQKNANALQYHFADRDGLLQAIVDKHGGAITLLRERYIDRAEQGEWPSGEAAARCLVLPIIDYIETDPAGLDFVKISSQMAAIYQSGSLADTANGLRYPDNRRLAGVFERALADIPGREAQRRVYLMVTNTFHSIADIYRAAEQQPRSSAVAKTGPMVEQLILFLQSFFSAPTRG